MMTELTFVQNHIIKYIFDKGLSGELCSCAPDDPISRECGITISSEIKTQMLVSRQLKEVLARHGALPDTIAFLKWGNLHIFLKINPVLFFKSKKIASWLIIMVLLIIIWAVKGCGEINWMRHTISWLIGSVVVTEVTSPLRKYGCTIRRDRSEVRKPVDGHCLDVTLKTTW